MVPMSVRSSLSRGLWRLTGWTFVGEPPTERAGILVGAPHTSNWDFVVMLAITSRSGIHAKFLAKKSLFGRPFGFLTRAMGGIPVDRSNPSGLVAELTARVRSGEEFFVVIAAEGTRTKGEFWKSGFYRLAVDSGLPISLGFVDRPTRTAGFGPTFRPTGDVAADMDLVRAFYADKQGIHPRNRTPARLREEPGAVPPQAAEESA